MAQELSMEELQKLLQAQIKSVLDSDEFVGKMQAIFEAKMKVLQETVIDPTSILPSHSNKIVEALGFAKVDGNYMTTTKGSIINFKNKSAPWVAISKDLENWIKDFAACVKSKGNKVSKLLQESSDTAGGFLVPEEFRALMIMYDVEPTVCISRSTVWPMSGEKLSFPKLLQEPDVTDGDYDNFAGVSFAWTEEGGEKSETEPEFGLVELIVHELAGYTEITNTLLDDSAINLINFITTLFRSAWYWMVDRSFIRGTGGKQPLGIVNDPTVLTVNRQTANALEVDDILNMESTLPAVFDDGAVWMLSKRARASLRGQKTTAGDLVLLENYTNIGDGYNASMLGKPVVMADGKVYNLGTKGDVIYGNWKWYYAAMRQDFSLDTSGHYKFRNNRTAVRCSGRVDGQAAIGQAFVVLTDPS
jgi:HK97 family phage major capsid protein